MKTKSLILGLVLISSSAFAERIENVRYCETHSNKKTTAEFLARDEASDVVRQAVLDALPTLRYRSLTLDIEYKGQVGFDAPGVSGSFTSNEDLFNKIMNLLHERAGADLSELDNASGVVAERVNNLVKRYNFPKGQLVSYGYNPGYHVAKEDHFSTDGKNLFFSYESGVFSKKTKTVVIDQISDLEKVKESFYDVTYCKDLRLAKEKLEANHVRGETTFVQRVLGCTTPVICNYIKVKTDAGYMELSLK